MMLSSIFLIDQDTIDLRPDMFDDLPEGLELEEGLVSPRFSGTTEAGDPFTVSADYALPGLDGYRLRNIEGRLERPGDPLDLTATRGTYNSDGEILILDEGVDLATQSGYRMISDIAVLALVENTVEVPVPVEITGPGLELNANALRTEPGSDMIWFEGDVRLKLTPTESEENEP